VPADPGWVPPSWPAAAVAEVSPPAVVDATTVPGLRGERVRNDAVGLQSRVMVLPGSAPMNERVREVVRAQVTDRAARAGVSFSPQVFPRGAGMADRGCVQGSTLRPAGEVLADPVLGPAGGVGTAVVCDIVLATGPYLGQRVRVVQGDGQVVGDEASTLYTHTGTGETVTAADLWLDGAAARLWTDVVEVLRREHGGLSLAPVEAPDAAGLDVLRRALDTTVVDPQGQLLIEVPAGVSAPELAGLGVEATPAPITIAVAPATARDLVTPFAAAMVAAVGSGEAFLPPPTVPAGEEEVDCGLLACVALTYDDGPSELTSGILDVAADRRASVTFFALGQNARPYADVLRRAVEEGHLVENHSWDHPQLTDLTPGQVTTQIRNTDAAITAATGERPVVFRPPYGAYDAQTLAAAGKAAILWDVDTLDWQGPSDDELIARAVDRPTPGSIVLQHDIHQNTARTAGAVYDGLADRGFELVNLRQLFGGALPDSGAVRSAR